MALVLTSNSSGVRSGSASSVDLNGFCAVYVKFISNLSDAWRFRTALRAGFSIANQISNQVNLQSSPGLIGDHLKCRFSISNQHQIVHQISNQVNWRFSANQRDDRRLQIASTGF